MRSRLRLFCVWPRFVRHCRSDWGCVCLLRRMVGWRADRRCKYRMQSKMRRPCRHGGWGWRGTRGAGKGAGPSSEPLQASDDGVQAPFFPSRAKSQSPRGPNLWRRLQCGPWSCLRCRSCANFCPPGVHQESTSTTAAPFALSWRVNCVPSTLPLFHAVCLLPSAAPLTSTFLEASKLLVDGVLLLATATISRRLVSHPPGTPVIPQGSQSAGCPTLRSISQVVR